MAVLTKIAAVAGIVGVVWFARKRICALDFPGDETTDEGVRKLLTLALYLGALIAILALAGVPMAALGAVLGGASAGLAFASKDFIGNILGAVILFVDRPFSLYDEICVGTYAGTVEEIGMRSTELLTGKGRVRLPNQMFMTQPVSILRKKGKK